MCPAQPFLTSVTEWRIIAASMFIFTVSRFVWSSFSCFFWLKVQIMIYVAWKHFPLCWCFVLPHCSNQIKKVHKSISLSDVFRFLMLWIWINSWEKSLTGPLVLVAVHVLLFLSQDVFLIRVISLTFNPKPARSGPAFHLTFTLWPVWHG